TEPAEAQAIANDRIVAAKLAGTSQIRVPRLSGPMSIHMERKVVRILGTNKRDIFVSAQNASGVQGIDMTFDYDPTKVSIVNVQPVNPASGFSAIWNDTPGRLSVAFYGYGPIGTYAERLVKITVQSLQGGNFFGPQLIRVDANEGLIP